MEDVNLRHEFHRALDAVAPPAPWLSDHVHQELRKRVKATPPRQRSRFGLVLTPAMTALIAAVLVVLLAAAAIGVALALRHYVRQPIPIPHSGPVSRGCSVQGGTLVMLDSNVGWRGTSRTTDGGKTWRDASPPLPPDTVKGPQSTCALDANHAWAIVSTGSVPYQPQDLIVMSTGDGGQTWQQGSAIAVPVAISWRIGFTAELGFFDDLNGWLLMEYESTPIFRRLYATSDGGAHWAVVSRVAGLGLGDTGAGCAENGIMFVTLRKGWLTWNCESGYGDQPPHSGPVVAGTDDGGKTWAPVNLPAFDATGRTCTAASPIFSRSDGVLQVLCYGFGIDGWTAVYSTADAGQTWTVHVLPVFVTVDFVDGTTGFYFHHDPRGNSLNRTVDGGRDWTVVSSGLFPGNQINSYTFFDARTGSADVSNSPVSWWTHDGGKTWSLPGPNRIVGTVVCTLPSDPAAGAPAAAPKMVSPTVGWMAGVRRTTDGGATWSRLGPPPAKDSTAGYGEFFLDATHAWVAQEAGSATACADHLVVFSSADGGATWKEGSPTVVQLTKSDPMGSLRIWLSFVDPDHGWLRLSGYGPQGPLYRTLDAGRHWTVVAQPAAFTNNNGCSGVGFPIFSSPTTGWMSTRCGDGTNPPLAFMVTHDGGATWSLLTLMPNLCCSTPFPTFFDAANGWLFEPNTPLLMMTSDSGRTWTSHGLPQLPGYACLGKHGENMTCRDQAFSAASFIDPRQGWVVISQFAQQKGGTQSIRFERTVDGGKTWTAVSSNLGGSSSPVLTQPTLTFVDQYNGFLWTGTGLFSTTDGGQTWKAVQMSYR